MRSCRPGLKLLPAAQISHGLQFSSVLLSPLLELVAGLVELGHCLPRDGVTAKVLDKALAFVSHCWDDKKLRHRVNKPPFKIVFKVDFLFRLSETVIGVQSVSLRK